MERKARVVATRAKALMEPEAMRVSVCGAGANQEGYRIKSEGLTLTHSEELIPMLTKLKAQGYEVASFAFKGDQWTDDAVNGWLKDGGYENVVVTRAGTEVSAKSADATEVPEGAETRTIKTEDGIEILVVKSAEPVSGGVEQPEDASEVQPVATTDSVKDDITSGDLANGGALNPEQKNPSDKGKKKPAASAEGEGMADDESGSSSCKAVMQGLTEALERAKSIKAAKVPSKKSFYDISEMAALIQGLKWMMQDMQYEVFYGVAFGDDDSDDVQNAKDTVDAMKNAGLWLLTALSAMMDSEMEALITTFTEVGPDGVVIARSEDGGSEVVEPTAEVTGDTVVVDGAITTGAIADKGDPAPAIEAPAEAAPEEQPSTKSEMEDAPAWAKSLFTKFETLSTTVGVLTARDTAETSTKGSSGEPEADAVQSRKSVDADVQPTSRPTTTEGQKATKAVAEMRFRGAIGI